MVAMLSTSRVTLKSSSDMLRLSRWAAKRLRVPELGRRRIIFSFFSSSMVTMFFFASGWLLDTASTRKSVSSMMELMDGSGTAPSTMAMSIL